MTRPEWVDRILDTKVDSSAVLLCFFGAAISVSCTMLADFAAPRSLPHAFLVVAAAVAATFVAVVLALQLAAVWRAWRERSGRGRRWTAEKQDWTQARRRHNVITASHESFELDAASAFFRLGFDDPATKRLHAALVAAEEMRTDTVPDSSGRQAYVAAVAELDAAWTAAGHPDPAALTLATETLSRRDVKHRHDWETVGYGGAGWHVVRCTICDD